MATPYVFLTGFGPFLDVELNPSGELAGALDGASFDGAQVSAVVLPVAFDEVAPAYRGALAALAAHGGERPLALLSMGVHREAWFRLERRARPQLTSTKPDTGGRSAAELGPLGDTELHTGLDLDALAAALERGGAREVGLSDDAGGYVCERTYYEVLERAAELGVPGLFLHVPPADLVPIAEQRGPVESLLRELVRQARATS